LAYLLFITVMNPVYACNRPSQPAGAEQTQGDDQQRPPKVHRAGSKQRPSSDSSIETAIKQGSQTRQRIFNILKQIQSKAPDQYAADRDTYTKALIEAMATDELSDDATRREVAEALVELMIGEAESRPLKDVEDVALWRMARMFDDTIRQLMSEWDYSDDNDYYAQRRLKEHIIPKLNPIEGYQEITWKQVGDWTYEPNKPIPAAVMALNEQRVTLGGFMVDLDYSEDNKVYLFLLVESLWDCCFGEPPTIEQGIIVTVPDGVAWTEGPLQVSGVLKVGEMFQEGELIGLHSMTTQRVDALKSVKKAHASSENTP